MIWRYGDWECSNCKARIRMSVYTKGRDPARWRWDRGIVEHHCERDIDPDYDKGDWSPANPKEDS